MKMHDETDEHYTVYPHLTWHEIHLLAEAKQLSAKKFFTYAITASNGETVHRTALATLVVFNLRGATITCVTSMEGVEIPDGQTCYMHATVTAFSRPDGTLRDTTIVYDNLDMVTTEGTHPLFGNQPKLFAVGA